MQKSKGYNIAWLLPAMGTGGISFQHIISEFTREFPKTVVYTGQWPGYAAGFEDNFEVCEVGATKFIQLAQTPNGYSVGFSYVSPSVIWHLFKFKPKIIYTNAFSVWTAIAVTLKQLLGCRVIIIYEGGSPGVDFRNSSLRLWSRRLMVRWADAFVVNGKLAKEYVVNVLKANPKRVYAEPFLVPSVPALLQDLTKIPPQKDPQQQNIQFLFVGQIVPRKGLTILLQACILLNQKGYKDYNLSIVGDGSQREELEQFAAKNNLTRQVNWLGKIPYKSLGVYFQAADVFVFPTYEDIWGMVLTEAMAFGKPVICSQGANAVEMVAEGENGFIYNPEQVEQLADYMSRFLENPALIETMGRKSAQIMARHTPEDATRSFTKAVVSL